MGRLPYPWAVSMPRQERLPAYRVLSHLVVMAAVAAVLGVVVAGLAIPFAGLAGIGARNVARTMDNLPEELKTEDLAQRTTILDANGNRLASLYDENRITVPLKGISRNMVKAVVAIEDYRFYQHGALDLKGTLRALITNQANSGVVQGGSSITQQLVKLTLISQAKTKAEKAAATDETYARKLKELRYAIALEQSHSKDWILERYLNTAYFGDGAYGVQAAAKHYFDVNARDLSLRQSALLAGLVKNPYGYDPTKFPDRAIERRDVVLDRMAELNVVPRDKAEKNKQRDLGLNVQEVDNGCVNSTAPFFCDYVLTYLLQDPAFGATVKERKNLLYNGGLTIKTTIDMTAQQAADNAVAAHVNPTDGAIGALAIEQPGTGNVLALAQSRPMGNRKKLGETYINFTVPKEYGGANGFQPGSTFKVFTLAAALGQGLPLTTQFDSPSPKTFDMSDFSNCPGEGTFGGEYTANNSTGTGWYNMYSGTRNSVNTFYLQLEELTGVCAPWDSGQPDGREAHRPGGRALPVLHPGHRRRLPARDGRGLRHLRRPRPALRVAPGDADPRLRRQPREGLRLAVHPGHAAERRRRREQRAARRDRGRLRLGAGTAGGGRRQDRDHPGAEGGVVLRLHRSLRRRRHDRRHRSTGTSRVPRGQDRRRRDHLRGVRLRLRGPDLG